MTSTKFPTAADQMRLVQSRKHGELIYSIRFVDDDGIEHECCDCGTDKASAQKYLGHLKTLEPRTAACLLAFEAIYPLAGSIARSSDDQGTREYATKSHMRAWGSEIALILEGIFDYVHSPSSDKDAAA